MKPDQTTSALALYQEDSPTTDRRRLDLLDRIYAHLARGGQINMTRDHCLGSCDGTTPHIGLIDVGRWCALCGTYS